MASSKDSPQFEREVFPAELEEIAIRRAELARRGDAEPGGADPSARSSPALGLVGLALSGGGIRSATFGLGVIQSLAECGILKSVDYLSTVSGGGYIGSCLSSVLNTEDAGPEGRDFRFAPNPGSSNPRRSPTCATAATISLPAVSWTGSTSRACFCAASSSICCWFCRSSSSRSC